MGKRRGIFSRLIDTRVDKWMSWDYIAENTGRIKRSVYDLATPEKPKYNETFREAMIRLNLTEEDLKNRKKEFTRLFYFSLILGICIIGYAVYMAYMGHFGSCLISFCLSIFCLAQAFKWHFWIFQIRNRKLGCTINEWLNGTVAETSTNTELTETPKSKDVEKKD